MPCKCKSTRFGRVEWHYFGGGRAIYALGMKGILLAIDRGAASWEATRLVVHMAPRLNAPVTVLSVLVPGTQVSGAKEQSEREYRAVRELVDDVVEELALAGITAKGEVLSSTSNEVAGAIVATATRLDAELIVMGSRARGELVSLLLGSVSHAVARNADCPIVIVPTGATARLTPGRIVLVIDGEGDTEKPVTATAALARAAEASVVVACVGRTLGDRDQTEFAPTANPDEAAVAAAVSTLEKAGVEVRSHMIDNVWGQAPEIAREVLAIGADMIVMGSRSMGWIGGDVAPGAAEAVIRRTHLPVVVAASRRRSQVVGPHIPRN